MPPAPLGLEDRPPQMGTEETVTTASGVNVAHQNTPFKGLNRPKGVLLACHRQKKGPRGIAGGPFHMRNHMMKAD